MANGVNVLNVIRQNATAVYQDRIPEATADNLHEVGDAILTYEAQANEFVNALVNRIGLVILNNRMATNPLAALKRVDWRLVKPLRKFTLMLLKRRPMTQELHRTLCLSVTCPMYPLYSTALIASLITL